MTQRDDLRGEIQEVEAQRVELDGAPGRLLRHESALDLTVLAWALARPSGDRWRGAG